MIKRYKNLGLIIHKDREIEEDVNYRIIKVGWMK